MQQLLIKIFPLRKSMLYTLKWAIGLLLLACASWYKLAHVLGSRKVRFFLATKLAHSGSCRQRVALNICAAISIATEDIHPIDLFIITEVIREACTVSSCSCYRWSMIANKLSMREAKGNHFVWKWNLKVNMGNIKILKVFWLEEYLLIQNTLL